MKINRLETHDRFLDFKNQWNVISQGCMECIENVPDAILSPFYVFAHPRTIDNQERVSLVTDHGFNVNSTPKQRLIWQPRITKPKAQTNSYLFLAQKRTDLIKIIWLLPPEELWENYEKGKLTENEDIWTSIQNYRFHRKKLEAPDPDGPTENDVLNFRRIMGEEAHKKKRQNVNELFKLDS